MWRRRAPRRTQRSRNGRKTKAGGAMRSACSPRCARAALRFLRSRWRLRAMFRSARACHRAPRSRLRSRARRSRSPAQSCRRASSRFSASAPSIVTRVSRVESWISGACRTPHAARRSRLIAQRLSRARSRCRRRFASRSPIQACDTRCATAATRRVARMSTPRPTRSASRISRGFHANAGARSTRCPRESRGAHGMSSRSRRASTPRSTRSRAAISRASARCSSRATHRCATTSMCRSRSSTRSWSARCPAAPSAHA